MPASQQQAYAEQTTWISCTETCVCRAALMCRGSLAGAGHALSPRLTATTCWQQRPCTNARCAQRLHFCCAASGRQAATFKRGRLQQSNCVIGCRSMRPYGPTPGSFTCRVTSAQQWHCCTGGSRNLTQNGTNSKGGTLSETGLHVENLRTWRSSRLTDLSAAAPVGASATFPLWGVARSGPH